jgi:tetratricopeptide (TPR) repeat protein
MPMRACRASAAPDALAPEEIPIAVAVERDKVLQAAQKFVERKRYDKAIAEYQKIVAEDPKDVRTLLKIGDLYIRANQYADAINTYEGVAKIYTQQGHALKAIAVYKQIRQIIDKYAPDLADAFSHVLPRLAELYTQLGLTSDAAGVWDDLANRLQKAGKEAEATEVLRKVVDLDPTNPIPHLRLAEAHIRAKDTPAAIQRLGTASEILLKGGRRDDALKVVERLLQLKPDAKYAKIAAQIYLDRGQPNDGMVALARLQISFKENPKDLETLGLLARAFEELKQAPKAIEVLKEAAKIAKDGNKPEVFNQIIEALLKRAPNDEMVRQLAGQRTTAKAAPAAAAPVSARSAEPSSVEIEEEEIDFDPDEYSELSEAEPVPLPAHRASRPSIPEAPAQVDDDAARIRQYLQYAESYRQGRDYPRAVGLLRDAVAAYPGSRELNKLLFDVLHEAGDEQSLIHYMLTFAHHLAVAQNDREGAKGVLDDLLLAVPGQPHAVQMLYELGYAVPQHEAYPPSQGAYAQQGTPAIVEDIDDPFAGVSPELQQRAAALQQQRAHTEGKTQAPTHIRAQYAPATPAPAATTSSFRLEEVMDQVDAYASHGMFNEARSLLDQLLARMPNHPVVLDRLQELEDQMSGRVSQLPLPVDQSGFRPMPISEPAGEDRAFDIAAAIDAIDAIDATIDGIQVPEGAPAEDPKFSIDTVFDQFRRGVQQQISESDAATHYDLGVAYREMGMFLDAINEFELAARDPGRECVCRSMIGMIHLQLGNVDAAIDSFLRGLEAVQKTKEQDLALSYEVGDAYEARKSPEQALYYFRRVAQLDANYKDPRGAVQDRIRRLEPAPVAKPAQQKAVGAELPGDDFDLAFDDLLKLP